MIELFDDDVIRCFIPNALETVEGERSLSDKLGPFIAARTRWIEDNLAGPLWDSLPERALWLARKVVAGLAFADAAPSLDLVLTPNGFGVVSTQEVAPASKDRVERLVESYRAAADRDLDLLLDELRRSQEWRGSERGAALSGSLILRLADARRWHGSGELLDTFRRVADLAAAFETDAAERFLGWDLMGRLREAAAGRLASDPLDRECLALLPLVRGALSRWLDAHAGDGAVPHTEPHELWHLLSPAMRRLKGLPNLYREVWKPEMAGKFEPEVFKNDIPGAFYF